jgi:CheY-like chemotaxis protein
MSLRVLLADESSTIKRVMQLALQDFGVEVKAVPVGLDVLQVAHSFHPDIVFADVLLAKKNGYEVCGELKADAELKNVPVVLMWSGFMELDEAKAQSAQADRRLEKPFDAEILRQLVKDLVPSARGNVIANYLSFPNLPPILEDKAPEAPKAPSNPAPAIVEFNSDEDEPEEFEQVPLQASTPPAAKSSSKPEDWSHQDLQKFKIDLPQEALSIDEADLTSASVALSSGIEEINLEDLEEMEIPRSNARPTSSSASSSTAKTSPALAALDPMHVEEVLRQEVRAVLESIAWKIIPDVAERVVREELQKLLKDAERL